MNPRKSIILCVDDEEANLKLLENILVPRGYTIVGAASGKDALKKIKSQTIDLVLLDILMPGMDGLEVCRQIKEDQKLRNIPVILITVLTAKKDRIRGIKAGADEFLSKPIDQTEALARIKILLKVKELSDERKRAEEVLQKSHDELECRVRERTAELAQANKILKTDIIERKLAEEELKKSESKFRAIFDNASDGMFIVDLKARKFFMCNAMCAKMLGYAKEEFLNLDIADIHLGEDLPFINEQIGKFSRGEEGIRSDIKFKRKNGSIFAADLSPALLTIVEEKYLLIIFKDIAERKRAEEVIRSSLEEKEVLLKEVHHRVKNNLMTIIGLIKMQETKANNEMFTTLLRELEGRVRSMALVHESLHKSEDLVHVDLQNYIETMSAHIRAQFGAERDIRFTVQAAGVDVGLDIAVPCGLILNELIANAYKHAFPGDKPRSGAGNCEIAVRVMHEDSVFTLTVADNGMGLPADLDWEKSETLGLRLIKMLSKQISGSIEFDSSAGTVFRLKFPMAVP